MKEIDKDWMSRKTIVVVCYGRPADNILLPCGFFYLLLLFFLA